MKLLNEIYPTATIALSGDKKLSEIKLNVCVLQQHYTNQ
jgi:hypothetical protein